MIFGIVQLLSELLLVLVVSLVMALVGLFVVSFIKSPRRGRLYLFAFFTPFIACYTFYFCLLGTSFYISQKYNVDSGFGTSWYVPLIGKSRLEISDIPQNAWIVQGDDSVVTSVAKLYPNAPVLWGKTFDSSCFVLSGDTLIYERESILVAQRNHGQAIAWQDADVFYRDRRAAIVGKADTLALLACIAVALMVVWLMKRIVLGKNRPKA